MEVQLSSGYRMPKLAFGTFAISLEKLESTIRLAFDAGFRHFDCASYYKNEIEIGQTFTQLIGEGRTTREELFITTKVWPTSYRNVEKSCRDSLRRLQTDYIDLYLLHWPLSMKPKDEGEYPTHNRSTYELDTIPLYQVWEQMERLVDAGLVRSIGVSNWTITALIDTLSYARIKPVCNQFELQPYYSREQLVTFCLKHHVIPSAYRVFADLPPHKLYPQEAKITQDPTILELAEKYSVTPSQLCIAWAHAKGIVVIVKSETQSRINENFQAINLALEPSDVQRVDDLPQIGSSAITYKLFGFNIDS